MLVWCLQFWYENVGKCFVKLLKIFVWDSGFVYVLFGIGLMENLLGYLVVGGSWEGFCIEMLIVVVLMGIEFFFFWIVVGVEFDFVLCFFGDGIWVIEIKCIIVFKVL